MNPNRFVLTEKTRKPIIWYSAGSSRGRTFSGIERFDCHVVSLYNEHGGGYFTVIPISPLDYRKKNHTNAKARIEESNGYVEFYVYDDWGSQHIMKIPKSMHKEIRLARQSAADALLI